MSSYSSLTSFNKNLVYCVRCLAIEHEGIVGNIARVNCLGVHSHLSAVVLSEREQLAVNYLRSPLSRSPRCRLHKLHLLGIRRQAQCSVSHSFSLVHVLVVSHYRDLHVHQCLFHCSFNFIVIRIFFSLIIISVTRLTVTLLLMIIPGPFRSPRRMQPLLSYSALFPACILMPSNPGTPTSSGR